ncbi:hypothetical protein [Roseomonas sp. KE0001]|uniref:hypothetical protein n=1 Tax=unclassified Roseomonas TaxID=2617492 RepID=UPI0018E05E52|nr:hypothetical protein [Roseomonas sp. KE0001]MBI0434368.1 hypothetical protein [Roseomonas sp. KE0001]
MRSLRSRLATCLLGGCLALSAAGQAKALDDLIFYEGNGCTQDIVFTYDSRVARNDNCKRSGPCDGDNDEARSLRILKSAAMNTRIVVFDSPDARQDDDFTVIDILRPDFMEDQGYCLRSFEQNFDTPRENQGILVDYVRKNGLDGKISRVRVIPNGTGG